MHAYRRLLQFVAPYRGRLVLSIACGLLSAAATGGALYVVRNVLRQVFDAGGVPVAEVLLWAAAVPLLFLMQGALDFANGYYVNWVGQRVVFDLRQRLFEHLLALSLDFHDRSNIGQLMSRVTHDAGAVEKSVSNSIVDVTKQPFTFLACLGMIVYLDWRLTLLTIGLLPLCVAPVLFLGRRTKKASREAQLRLADLVSVLHEALTGIRVVQAYEAERGEQARFGKANHGNFRQRMRALRYRLLLNPLIMFVASLGMAAVFIYAFARGMSHADFLTFILAMLRMYEPVKAMSRVWAAVQEAAAPAERIFEVLDQKATVVERSDARPLPLLSRAICFDRVGFGYNSDRVLEGIELEIPVGSFTAVVGPSGSGKTTLLNLLARFYDPTEGAVRMDGLDVREATLHSLRSQIGIVTQETILFNDTIARNIAYGRPDATRAEIEAAAKKARAHEFIVERPDGYDTVVGEKGIQLSGGQRQRIAIARALLKNPPILILDEATSALDSEQERAVQAALEELMKGRTVLAIAHRLSTVQRADRIVVLEGGRVVESGTHGELLVRGGLYKKLYDLQFKA